MPHIPIGNRSTNTPEPANAPACCAFGLYVSGIWHALEPNAMHEFDCSATPWLAAIASSDARKHAAEPPVIERFRFDPTPLPTSVGGNTTRAGLARIVVLTGVHSSPRLGVPPPPPDPVNDS